MGSACIYFNDPATCYECQRCGWSRLVADRCIALTCTAVATAVCVCVCVRARVRGHACVRDVFAIYDNNI